MNVDQQSPRDAPIIPALSKIPSISRKSNRSASATMPGSKSDQLPFLHWLSRGARSHIVAMSGEFIGTFLFLFFAFSGTQLAKTANKQTQTQAPAVKTVELDQGPNPAQLLYISLCFGFSLAVNVWVFFRISGGLFNPAVTFGMCLIGAMSWSRGVLILVSQIAGAIASAGIVNALFPGPLVIRTALGGGTKVVQGVFIEMFLTAQLVFTIFMLAAEKHKATFIAPIGIGLSLFIAELTGVYHTGGSVNPARTLGPCVVLHSFYTYHWIYWVGPLLGTLLAVSFYKFIKILEYETVNPEQDADEHASREVLQSRHDRETSRVGI